MKEKIFKLLTGTALSSLGITMVIHANLGVFPITSCNLAIANLLNISVGTAGALVEMLMLLLAYKLKEGVTITGLTNATIGSFAIDLWSKFLPYHPLMILGIFLLPIAWSISGSAGLGDTHQNLVTNGILKRTKKSMKFVRNCQESLFMGIGLLGGGLVTPLTIVLSLFFGSIMQLEYKIMGYDPTKIQHRFLIKGKAE